MALDTGHPMRDKPIRHLARRHRGWRALSALFDNGRVLPAPGKRPNPADGGALWAQRVSVSLFSGTCLTIELCQLFSEWQLQIDRRDFLQLCCRLSLTACRLHICVDLGSTMSETPETAFHSPRKVSRCKAFAILLMAELAIAREHICGHNRGCF
jgi:hypothetical protein